MQRLAISWLGHGTFLLRTPGGTRVIVDPWLHGNPSCPDSLKKPPKVDLILVTHGHSDHIDDLILVARTALFGDMGHVPDAHRHATKRWSSQRAYR